MAPRSTPLVAPSHKPQPPRKKPPVTAKRLRARLLTHVARQIDRLDAVLDAAEPSAGLDSGKVLRDLVGLKHLLDELMVGNGGGDGASGPPLDVVALRADIARRYAAFAADEPDDGVFVPSAAETPAPPGG
ncbi:hypothetical protein [Methylobacterium sp. Leaf118]|uniref:hypothetical protein n=1 Tax=Methylobacterium sp. Leaf118 TaxID=2876562 RepID=UPI001E403A99|nr:hypothetical protein [Methylobacterium sp. Leaf118]